MKVILTEKVQSLGNIGEVVNVSQGYGRNFLIPQSKAVLADSANQKQLKHHERRLAKKVEGEKNIALEVKKKLDGLKLELIKKVGISGRLFGTVTSVELSKILAGQDIDVERRMLTIENPIKTLGAFDIKAKLFTGVEATFSVTVIMDPKQVEEIKKKEEALAKRAAAKKEASEAEGDEAKSEEPEVELTEEQKLKAEADRLLRS